MSDTSTEPTWSYHTDVDESRTLHIWPDNDLIEHELDTLGCPCGPLLELSNDGWVVIVSHNALDKENCAL